MVSVSNPNGLVLHHGTAASRVEGIRANGLQPATSARYPASYAMLTTIRELAWNHARLNPVTDRALITYRIPAHEIDSYLYPSSTADGTDYPHKRPIPGRMIIQVETDIPEPQARRMPLRQAADHRACPAEPWQP